jgi:hypothetical protein
MNLRPAVSRPLFDMCKDQAGQTCAAPARVK